MDVHLSHLSVRLPGMEKPLFHVRELQVAAGARVLIQGPSGRGKTTLLHLLAGLFQPASGHVRIGGHELTTMNESSLTQFRAERVGLIFQKLNLVSHLTALENVCLGDVRGKLSSELAREALRRMKLDAQADVLAHRLSLGQQQRVAVSRVLAKNPPLVLADEPTSSLDDENARAVAEALLSLPSETTLIVVSHDHRLKDRFTTVFDFEKVAHA